MPAILDDPTAPTIFRVSGEPPFPAPHAPLPADIVPRQVTLRDRVTIATIVPFSSPSQVPLSLVSYLCDQLNKLIEEGDTYPMVNSMPLESFGPYWFGNFAAVMILGDIRDAAQVRAMAEEGADWEKLCLGTFYTKPNYPGRSSHVCNAGFVTTDASRNRGVGRLMGEQYVKWAPKLGYTYSVFNLVYETNVASCRIWDALGFKRIGRVKGCGNLKSYPDRLVDAIIYGRDLGQEEETEDDASEERFDKIKYYLEHGTYPNGADRAEKSRLRSAATHYKLVMSADGGGEAKLMLKGKEVVADPKQQYDVARRVHLQQETSGKSHAGINKTTAAIAEKYHWERIKATVNAVIKDCPECKIVNKPPSRQDDSGFRNGNGPPRPAQSSSTLSEPHLPDTPSNTHSNNPSYVLNGTRQSSPEVNLTALELYNKDVDEQAQAQIQREFNSYAYGHEPQQPQPQSTHGSFVPVDPQIMEGIEQANAGLDQTNATRHRLNRVRTSSLRKQFHGSSASSTAMEQETEYQS